MSWLRPLSYKFYKPYNSLSWEKGLQHSLRHGPLRLLCAESVRMRIPISRLQDPVGAARIDPQIASDSCSQRLRVPCHVFFTVSLGLGGESSERSLGSNTSCSTVQYTSEFYCKSLRQDSHTVARPPRSEEFFSPVDFEHRLEAPLDAKKLGETSPPMLSPTVMPVSKSRASARYIHISPHSP